MPADLCVDVAESCALTKQRQHARTMANAMSTSGRAGIAVRVIPSATTNFCRRLDSAMFSRRIPMLQCTTQKLENGAMDDVSATINSQTAHLILPSQTKRCCLCVYYWLSSWRFAALLQMVSSRKEKITYLTGSINVYSVVTFFCI
uniref:Uncharacterized protein n=1 Tax=Ascaris lumbricoides TaxID=6252 RepID=A0A0M3HNB0_ASCLU